MDKYTVLFYETRKQTVQVEAETEQEAIDKTSITDIITRQMIFFIITSFLILYARERDFTKHIHFCNKSHITVVRLYVENVA